MNELILIAAASAAMSALGCGAGADGETAPTTSFPADPLAIVTSDEGKLTIEVRTGPSQPPGRGKTDVQLLVRNTATGELVDDLEIQATPWMPVMGHGAPVMPQAAMEGHGTYAVRNVSMYMPGIWELHTTFSGVVTDTATPVFDVP